MCVPCCASNRGDRCAIIGEVARDWNYAAAGIYAESAFNFSARAARKFIFVESAFLSARALTRRLRGAQTRITSSELLERAGRRTHEHALELELEHREQKDNRGSECQPMKCLIEFAGRRC
jgi:hypothetical protein